MAIVVNALWADLLVPIRPVLAGPHGSGPHHHRGSASRCTTFPAAAADGLAGGRRRARPHHFQCCAGRGRSSTVNAHSVSAASRPSETANTRNGAGAPQHVVEDEGQRTRARERRQDLHVAAMPSIAAREVVAETDGDQKERVEIGE